MHQPSPLLHRIVSVANDRLVAVQPPDEPRPGTCVEVASITANLTETAPSHVVVMDSAKALSWAEFWVGVGFQRQRIRRGNYSLVKVDLPVPVRIEAREELLFVVCY